MSSSVLIQQPQANYQITEEEEDYRDVVESLAEFKDSGETGKSWEELQKELKLYS